jgi:hypothetical protein
VPAVYVVFVSALQTKALPFHWSLSVPLHVGELIENIVPVRSIPLPLVYVVSLSGSVIVFPFDIDRS